jgi:hypothetical protein
MSDSKAVLGKDMICSIKIGENYFPVFCAKSCSFDFSNEIILRTGVNDGLFPKRRVRRSDWRGSASGVVVTNNTTDRYSPFYLLQEGIRRSVNTWQFEFTNADSETVTLEGEALIEGIPLSGDTGGFAQTSVNIVGSGGFLIDASVASDPPTDENVDSDFWECVAGETSISGLSYNNKSLVGKTILAVARTGAAHDPITTGSPVNLQAKFLTGSGSISFDANIPFNDGETVWAMWKD